MKPGPDEIKDQDPEGNEQEPFLSRWSRRKQDAREQLLQPARNQSADPDSPAPELPPLDQLTPDSDFRAFFHPKVNEDVRRAALKKLFSNPHFNVMDGLDTYIDDYSKTEPIPAAMMAGLRQAQNILQWAKEDEEQRARDSKLKQEASAPALVPPANPPAPVTGARSSVPGAVPASPDDMGGQTKS